MCITHWFLREINIRGVARYRFKRKHTSKCGLGVMFVSNVIICNLVHFEVKIKNIPGNRWT